ncbi:efflux RND transporter periplasmic adaptor subunit [Pseudomonas sp. OIL-1]|uniref:efflux RND transporter periplasmic adaptor subunit n=1 Tax=Pseudomonas sp. OIL-1 TaxID=2706126 RepID=UPI0013A7B15F|nr:efflux RND transporter periplasmic adaptor subunit [Pseudomonas sp. OIL-1]QIB50256.1 efflux RND transporter periplasmic adaptor subunit [Pseudomonas sp. OIL-1]
MLSQLSVAGRLFLALLLSSACFSALAQNRPEVRVAKVSTTDIVAEVPLNGTVNPMRSSGLSTSVAGLLDQVSVEPGTRVAAGDLLMRLDDEQAALQLEQAAAAAEESRVALIEARRRMTEAQSVGAGRNIAATEISARESVAASAAATLKRLEAESRSRQVSLQRHRIEAPFDGVVSQRLRDLGEWVTPGDELLRLVDIKNLRLDFQVPQAHYARINERTRLQIEHQGESLKATIETLVPVTDSVARTFLLRARAPTAVKLLPGMAVQATLRLSTGKQGLTVPRDAVNRYPEGRVTVWLAEPHEESGVFTVTEKRVELGTAFEGQIEVTHGLQGGERVVTHGNESLSEGIQVSLASGRGESN